MTITATERINRIIPVRLACCLGIVLAVACGFSPVYAAPPCAPWAGKALSVEGRVELSRAGTAGWRSVVLEDLFCPGDSIRVDRRSRAAVLLPNETLLRLDEGSTLNFSRKKKEQPFWVELLEGAVHFISRTPRSLEVKTPYVNAAIEGTEFVVRVEPAATTIWVFEGQVAASNPLGTLQLASGEAATAEKAKAPTRRLVVRPRDAVQWALYYPPLIDLRTEAVAEGPDAALIRKALQEYRDNDLPAAFASLAKVPPPSRTVQFYNLRAGLLLSVGRVDEARSDIDRSLLLDATNGTAFALRSVIAVTQNDNQRALELARKGAELSPQTPSPQIALSYAYQALFDIERAKKSVEQAIALAPGDALAWARLAELELSLGYLDRALAAAQQAAALNPDLAHTQSVLGFAYLTRIQIPEAKAAFQKAVTLNPAAPLPRLGLGLAMIRRGNLNNGTDQIEIAAILDPDNALIRSYLGKAYFEQKRIDLARTEYATAKRLDPNDPTPWFYSAILKQTTNQPVAALHDLQKAMALNDNRAVYRSRLLLDSDAASRGASLARIYENLGFEQLGVNEAAKSLAFDPSSTSAHRFLSDLYATRGRHEIARVSELLQAQLLQDININPVQPSLSATNLNIAATGGPTTPGFAEFTPLFERNQAQLNVTGELGNKDTRAGEAVVSGIYDRFSLSAGQFHYDTDGFRRNYDLKHNITNLFAQAAITPELNVQGEVRIQRTENGDRRLLYDPDFFDPSLDRDLDDDMARFGFRYSPSPRADLIGSVIYAERHDKLEFSSGVETPAFSLIKDTDIREKDKAIQGEGAFFYSGDSWNLVTGYGYFDVDRKGRFKETETIDIAPMPPFFGGFKDSDTDIDSTFDTTRQHSGYAYSNIEFPENATWTIGFSYDDYDEDDFHRKIASPKFGLQWDIFEDLRLRLATLRTIKPVLTANRTIQPTQVAGFNQFFDDRNGTESWLYGAGLDARLSEDLSAGVEASARDLSEPRGLSGNRSDDKDEQLYRGYLYWSPHPRWALSGEATLDIYDNDDDITAPRRVRTLTTPVSATWFSPLGFFAGATATYVNHKSNWGSNSDFPDGHNSFVLADLAAGFRFPKRRGLVSFEVRNIFDENFNYQDDSFREFGGSEPTASPFVPEREFLARLTLNF